MQLNEVASHVKIVKSTGAIYPTKIFGPQATDTFFWLRKQPYKS